MGAEGLPKQLWPVGLDPVSAHCALGQGGRRGGKPAKAALGLIL